jgi:transcription initiation factor TFIIIB Brf1 subunit/transcription initiation factor TFIIB
MLQIPNMNDCGLCGSPLFLNEKVGCSVCKSCGAIMESRMVDQTAEYRCFKEKEAENNPVRVGKQVNLEMSRQIDLITIQEDHKSPNFWKFRGNVAPEDGFYTRGMSLIKKYCSLLDCPSLTTPSVELFTEIKNDPAIKGKRLQTTIAAVVFLAGRRSMNLIDLKSFINISDTTYPKLLKACGTILKLIPRIIVKPFDLIKRYAAPFGLCAKELSSIEKLCVQIEESDVLDGKLPKNTTIAASVLYFYSLHHPTFKVSLSDLKEKLGVDNDSLIRSYVASMSSKKAILAKGWTSPKTSEELK